MGSGLNRSHSQGSFSKSSGGGGGGAMVNTSPTSPIYPNTLSSIRETGIIDKLMPTFGFIICCERNESIFFHFSQYSGSSSDLRAGDEIEFEVGTDSRTHKLIARRLVKLPAGTVSFESISEERLLGKVDCEPRVVSGGSGASGEGGGKGGRSSKSYADPGMGRIIYERSGEFFFIPYAFTDVNDERDIHKGDEVSFYMAKNKRSGALRARLVRLVQPATVETVQGIVKTLKDSFGFIERADVEKDIFFHYSELSPGAESEMAMGACVEFVIQSRQGKEVATQIKVLPSGSVQFDSVAEDMFQGAVRTPVIRSFTHGRGKELEPQPGELVYQSDGDGITNLPYTHKDQVGDFTMLAGDIVHFSIATDKRNRAVRATNVTLHKLIESQREPKDRETGMIAALRDGFGFIKCAERDTRLFFHFNEVIDTEHKLTQHDEVEFTVQNDYTNERLHAVRVKILTPGSVQFEEVSERVFSGSVEDELAGECGRNKPNILKIQADGDRGTVHYLDSSGEPQVVSYYWASEALQFGDQVEFRVATRSYDKLVTAVDIKVMQKSKDIRFRGFVATLKDSYGFIESEEHDCELFFPFSSCNKFCDPRELEIMDEVEYCIVRKSNRLAADEIKKLPRGTIATEQAQPGVHEGSVLRPMKSSEYPQDYEGLIKPLSNGTTPNSSHNGSPLPPQLPYTATSLIDHRIVLQEGDPVSMCRQKN
jgi:cold shock CspA family protein